MKIDDIVNVKILRLNNEGEGVGKIDGIIIFIPNTLVGEIVEAKITEINKNYLRGKCIQLLKTSGQRIKPICPYFYKCGGCNLMHLKKEKQLNFKKEKVKNIFKKISNEEIEINNIYSYNDLYYRNKVVFKVENSKIGFYKKSTNQIIDIDKCYIIDNKLNEILKSLKKFIKENKVNNISEITIRIINNKIMILLDNINKKYESIFIEKFKYLDSIYINNKNIYKEKVLVEKIDDLKFSVSIKSFFQVNKEVSTKMYEYAVEKIKNSDITLDLYSGTGTITLLLSKKSKEVIGIEVNKEAVKDANENLKLNNITNVKFICNKVENEIENLKKLNINNIILDPPRSGSDKKTLNQILQINPEKIIYISCNPITLSRDYNILKEKYKINEITLFDMFPNTYHIESLMVLERK